MLTQTQVHLCRLPKCNSHFHFIQMLPRFGQVVRSWIRKRPNPGSPEAWRKGSARGHAGDDLAQTTLVSSQAVFMVLVPLVSALFFCFFCI